MRSGDRPARVRIELLGQTLRAVDPDDKNRSCTFATGVDENRIRDVKYSLWEGFNDVRQGCAFGGVLSPRAGADVARRLYIQGASALARLVDKPAHLYELQDFLSARIPENADPEVPGQIIDVIMERDVHLPLESMPLFGAIDDVYDSDTVLRGIQRVMPAYRSVIRRVKLSTEPPRRSSPEADWPRLSVRFFQHVHLAGMHLETRHLAELQKAGKLSVDLVFPPRAFKSNRDWPELDLAECIVTKPRATSSPRDESGFFICHFSCHLSHKVPDSVLHMRARWAWGEKEYSLTKLRGARGQLGPSVTAPAVVFLNTCRSGVGDRRAHTSAVEVLSFYEPRCLIGTLADLPDLTAAAFSRYFYRTLCDGASVGNALREARLRLLQNDKNAYGIFYTSYFGEDVAILTEVDRARRRIPNELTAVETSIEETPHA